MSKSMSILLGLKDFWARIIPIIIFHQKGGEDYTDHVLIFVHKMMLPAHQVRIKKHLLSTYCMQSRYYYSHFADKKTETRKGLKN